VRIPLEAKLLRDCGKPAEGNAREVDGPKKVALLLRERRAEVTSSAR
jgi:hypothetical protein